MGREGVSRLFPLEAERGVHRGVDRPFHDTLYPLHRQRRTLRDELSNPGYVLAHRIGRNDPGDDPEGERLLRGDVLASVDTTYFAFALADYWVSRLAPPYRGGYRSSPRAGRSGPGGCHDEIEANASSRPPPRAYPST